MCIEKLRKRGLLKTRIGKPSTSRGGKAIKYYELTNMGVDSLVETKRIQDKMWKEFSEYTLGLKKI